MRQTPLTCSGHTRPVVDLAFSGITPYGYFLISACKGEQTDHLHRNDGFSRFGPGPAPGCESACNEDVTACSSQMASPCCARETQGTGSARFLVTKVLSGEPL